MIDFDGWGKGLCFSKSAIMKGMAVDNLKEVRHMRRLNNVQVPMNTQQSHSKESVSQPELGLGILQEQMRYVLNPRIA